MPASKAASGSTESRRRVAVFVGNFNRKVKKKGGGTEKELRPCIINVQERAQKKLNLPLATAAQTERKEGEKEIEYDGCFHGKTVYVPDPVDTKTAAGATKYVSFKVPGYVTKKQLKDFFKATKVESFRIGGRLKAVPKA